MPVQEFIESNIASTKTRVSEIGSLTIIGQYEIISKIGEGGMGEVYRARDKKLSRDVAIKVLPASLATDADRLNRFRQEARAVGQLNHPNILVVHHIGRHAGAPVHGLRVFGRQNAARTNESRGGDATEGH
jgi:serine/threonine protein kinase